ncbi:FG-GAP-like repeat-containing protein [Synechococcus sp. UW140]|uniref:beta strand repeat-containing protein n=1 Tax=Synechococcus sp. UW140 TaxID=368503 RepID=UPI003137927F
MTLYTVTTTADTGTGSLRQAILDANATAANDEIIFDSSIFLSGVNTIALGAAFPAIDKASSAGSLIISGPGASSLIINGNQGNYSIFKINTGGNLTISGVTVTGANLSGSGGAFSNSGALNIYSSTISGNSVTGNGANGGAINNNGSLNIINSTISGNTSSGSSSKYDNYGGGINNSGTLTVSNSTISNNTGDIGGGINNSRQGSGNITISNSTLSGNTAISLGGGINNYNNSGTLNVTNCTLSGNSAPTAGGLHNNGTLNIANTIIANSLAPGNIPPKDYFGGGTINTNLNNLIEDGTLNDTTGNSSGSGNISGDPLLSPLANNGGSTFTMALGATSPAIAAGDANVSNAARIFGLDQRGYILSATTPSIGAYEFNGAIPPAPSVTSVSPSTGSPAGGNSITITGTNLAGATAVTIGGTAVNFTVVSSTSITTTTPAHTAGAVGIEVTTVGGTNSANTLYSYVPTVTQNLSNLANNATTLTITGTGFDPIAANNTVILSSGTGTVTSATATQLTVTFITAPIEEELRAEVFTNGISSGNQVEVSTIVLAPVIDSISPAAGPRAGGSTITIAGQNFINVTGVSIGGIAATNFTVVNGEKITATIPPGIFGPADVLVTTVNGTNSTTANTEFNYTAGAFDAPAEPFAPAFPHAISINAPGSVVGTSASFTVTFNQPVTGVDAADFTLIRTGTVAGGTIQVTGSGATRTVTVTGITGAGTLGLNLVSVPTIIASPSFAAQATIDTGSKPASVILGDVNGDCNLDIITANINSANVSVLLGNGNGTFQGQQIFDTGTNPFAVKLGDMNGDGSVDIITANQDSDTASVLLGNGNGTFQTQTTFSTGDSPRSVALGDLNGDGTLDIIAANQGSNKVSVLLGTGNGSFAVQATFATDAGTDAGPYSLALGDVNGDGKLDIVTANQSSNQASVLLGNGDGTFAAEVAFATGANPFSVALGDLNGDGTLDIITANLGSTTVSVLLGNGNGTFQGQQAFATGANPFSVSMGDVNGDGRLDITTANLFSDTASVLLGNGNGTFGPKTDFATGSYPASVTLGDVNGDGRLDIIAANYNSDNASVILGTGGSALFATFSPQQTFAAGNGAQSQALGDLNGDGKLDMVTANGGDSTASVLLGNGNGTFQTQATVSTGTAPRSVTLGDVNDDGRLDLITANRDSSTVSVLLGNGNGTFGPKTDFATGSYPASVTLGDVNGDGRPDIITANLYDNVSLLLGNGNGTFGPKTDFATGSGPRAVAMGDVDGDGRPDIITANRFSDNVSVLLGNGNGTFGPKTDFATGSYPASVTLGDVNGDGRLDIIAANYNSDNASVILGNGNGTFQTQATFATNRPYSVTLGDINGDGRLDIITASYSSDTASVLLGNGNGTFAAEVAFAAGNGPLSVALGDLNGDGRFDITTANFNSGDASVLLNSLAFTGQTATVDAIAPAPPTITSITDDAAPITGSIAPGGSTNDTSLLLTGSAEAASTVSIYNGSTLLGTTTANNTGVWSYTTNLSNGTTTYVFNATATDAPGNISPASSPNYSVTVDTAAPAAPTITSITDDAAPITGTIAPGGFTNDTSLLLTGSAEAASSVSIYNGSTLLGTTTADTTTGAWSYSATGLANGTTYAFKATATDAAGNVSKASSPQQTFTTETGPFSVTLGDVNGDGRLDIITANFGTNSNSASVLLGNGNGTFGPKTDFATGYYLASVTLGDVNGDGRLDIITANQYSANVSVLLGNGNGTFQTQATFATGSNPRAVALGDINGDGRLDIITANQYSANVSVLLGNGNGSFQDKQTLTTDAGPVSVALGDMNGDGRLDIITANRFSANVSVLLDSLAFTGQRVTVDTAAPAAPTITSITDDAAPSTGIIAPGGFTSDTSLLLTGSAEAASSVSIYNGSELLGTTTADTTTGAWSYSATGLSGGSTYVFNATATDAAGNISDASSYSVTVDTSAPAAPTITSITDNAEPITGTIAPGGFTNDTSLLLTGSAEAASTVSIYNGSELLGTTTADNTTGTWSYSATGLLGGSTYTFKATATDAAGNISDASSSNYSVTVDTSAPAAPTITSITDNVSPITGTIAPGGFTNDTSLLLTGSAEAASTVSIYNGSELLGTTTANNTTGAWSYSATGLLGGSTYSFKATATDAAGNISPASTNYSVSVDTTSPSPSPSGITSANSNGRYGFGSTITLLVAFSETVYVNGSPTLLLETGSTDRAAVYKSGSGTNTLSFDYTVQLGDQSADLEISSSSALSLQGGSIQDLAGNNAILTLPAIGANAALVIDDSAPSAGTTFTTTQGASGLINKPVVIDQKTDPLTGGSVVANTLLVFNNATPDSSAASALQLLVNSNGSNPAATVTSASDLISFRVSPSVSTSGNVSNLDVNGITTSAVAAFQATIQEVDLYFPEAPGSGWNALYKKNKNGGYFLFNYDPLTGLGGVLLDRDGINGIDGARLYLKDGALGDFDETVNGEIDDPIGFTTLSIAPTLRISDDNKGFSVDGVDGTGLWISLNLSSFSSTTQSNLEIYNNNTNENYGAIGATLGSGPSGSQAIYLAAGNTIGFRYRNGAGQVNSNPALSIISTATGFSLGLDADLNGTYTDLMLDITSSITASSPANLAIARKQFTSSDAILDLTSIAATGIQLTLDISTDCGMRNRFGFVKLDPVTGSTYQVAGVSQNDGAVFRSAVLSQFIDPYINSGKTHGFNQSSQTITWDLTSSAAGYYAPVMITETGEVLTFGASTASDGRQHVKLLGDNTFGFEDLLASQGSDWDFNDTKIKVSVV